MVQSSYTRTEAYGLLKLLGINVPYTGNFGGGTALLQHRSHHVPMVCRDGLRSPSPTSIHNPRWLRFLKVRFHFYYDGQWIWPFSIAGVLIFYSSEFSYLKINKFGALPLLVAKMPRQLESLLISSRNLLSMIAAYVSVTIDDCFAVHGLRLKISKKGDYFLFMPRRKLADGTYVDIVLPIDNGTRRMIEEKVFAAYQPFAGEPVKRLLPK